MRFYTSNERGFTMVEVLVAVAILAVLSTVAMFSYQEVRKKARDTERISNIESLRLALRIYKDAYDGYPSFDDGVVIGEGGALDSVLAPFLGGTIHDPLGDVSDGVYEYVYDSSFDCGGAAKKVLYAKAMERAASSNWATICGGTSPGANTYVVVLQ